MEVLVVDEPIPRLLSTYGHQKYAARKALQGRYCAGELASFFASVAAATADSDDGDDADGVLARLSRVRNRSVSVPVELLERAVGELTACMIAAETEYAANVGKCQAQFAQAALLCGVADLDAAARLIDDSDAGEQRRIALRAVDAAMPVPGTESAAMCAFYIQSIWECVAPPLHYQRDSVSVQRLLVLEKLLSQRSPS